MKRVYFDLNQVAELTGYAKDTLYTMIRNKQLKARQPTGKNGKYVVAAKEIERIFGDSDLQGLHREEV